MRLVPALVSLAFAFVLGIGLAYAIRMRSEDSPATRNGRNVVGLSNPRMDMTLPDTLPAPRIVVDKSDRRMRLYDGEQLLREYRVGLGFTPEGDKEREGDGKTPEGVFYICMRNPNSRYTLSLGISYPNEEDAARGLRQGMISASDAETIRNAIARKARPPWKTALGGEICIHGKGASRDWTHGCIALDDADIAEIFPRIPLGAPVEIRP